MRKISYAEPLSLRDLTLEGIRKHAKGRSDYNHSLVIEEFEDSLAEYLNVKYCVCVNAGTTGLMLALKALGIEAGKEVIVPSYTFCGTVHPLAWNGITPRFIDIDRDSFNLDLNKISRNINKRTAAILAVHTYGNPCDVEFLEAIAKEHDINLLFDSASGFGCKYKGRKLGGFGDLEVFSLQATKVMTVLEGGFISTNDEDLYKKLLLLRRQGNRGDGNCTDVGLNARMHPLAAVLGLAALKDIDKNIKKRRKLGEYYYSLLSKIPGLSFQKINEQGEHTYVYIPLLMDKEIFGLSRNELRQKLAEKGIDTGKYFHPPVHRYDCYSHLKVHSPLKITDYVADNVICLPFYSSISPREIESVCKTIDEIRKHRKSSH